MQCGLHVRRQPGPYDGEVHSGRRITTLYYRTIENKCRCDVPVYCRDLLLCLTLSNIDLPGGVVGQDTGKTWEQRYHIKN